MKVIRQQAVSQGIGHRENVVSIKLQEVGIVALLFENIFPVITPVKDMIFAQSQLRRNKTDPLDSEVIAQFCAALKPAVWRPPTPEQRQLRALVRHQRILLKTLTQQTNRRATCKASLVKASHQRVIEMLEAEIKQMEQQIQTFIDEHPDLKQQYKLLTSIKRIGPTCAMVLLAEMYDLADYGSTRAAAADVGLTPSQYTSGKTIHHKPKLSKIGKASVRGILFFSAMTAMQHNPTVRALKERLQAHSKDWKVIMSAAMRKLIHLAYAIPSPVRTH